MKPLEGQRTCFRLVGGILVERTVAQVLPAVQANLEGVRCVTNNYQIISIVKQLAETYKKREDDLNVFQKKWNIQVKA